MARALEQEQGGFRACYEQGRERDPNLTGRVVVQVTVDGEGNVSDVRDVSEQRAGVPAQGRPSATGPLPDPAVRSCLCAAWSKLRLPVRSRTLLWPMYFSPDKREQVSEELQ